MPIRTPRKRTTRPVSRFTSLPIQDFQVDYNRPPRGSWEKGYAGHWAGVWKPLCKIAARSPIQACAIARARHHHLGLYRKLRATSTWVEREQVTPKNKVPARAKGSW